MPSPREVPSQGVIRVIHANADFDDPSLHAPLRVPTGTPMLFELPEWRYLGDENHFLLDHRLATKGGRAKSAQTYAQKLSVFVESSRADGIKHYSEVTWDWLFSYREGLRRELKNSTVNQMIAVVESFFEWLTWRRKLERSPFSGGRSLKLQEGEIPIRTFSKDDLGKIFSILREPYKLMARLCLCTGLRAFEVSAIKLEDLPDFEETGAWVKLRVRRKGRSADTYVNCPRGMAEEVYRYAITPGRLIPRVPGPRYVFRTSRGVKMNSTRLTKEFTAAARAAGVYRLLKTLHALRHTFAIAMLISFMRRDAAKGIQDGGMNALVELRDVMGHISMASTQRYLSAVKLSQDGCVDAVTELYEQYVT